MSKVVFSTNKYVQDEIAKIKLDLEQTTNEGLEDIKNAHSEDVKNIEEDIKELQKTVNDELSEAMKETQDTIDKMKEDIAKDLDDLSQNILVENIVYGNSEYGQIKNVKDALDRLLYTDLVIGFTSTANLTNELGITLSNLQLNWTYNRLVRSQSIDNVEIHKDSRAYRYPTPVNTDKTITLRVNDGVKDFTKSLSFKFLNGLYYGVGFETSVYDSEFILRLTKELASSRGKTFTLNCGVAEHIYYSIPVRFGNPSFVVGGFEGGFTKVATIDFTNASGYTEQYAIWKSTNSNLGNTTVTVK